MANETYPCYVKVGVETEEFVELPTEDDGTLLLTTVASQFPGAVGLRFKSESGAWRGVRLNDNHVIDIPLEGWGDTEYCVVLPERAAKRKADDDDDDEDEDLSPLEKMSKMTEKEILTDLVVLNMPYEAKEADMKAYFEKYGDLDMCEIKYDNNKKSRGFGFIRYKTVEAVKAVLEATHVLEGRELEVCFPKDKSKDDGTPTKLFVGRLPKGLKENEFREHFEKFGALKDAYIPTPARGYGFVTYKKQSVARTVLNSTHVIQGQYVNVTHPSPKKSKEEYQQSAGDYKWKPGHANMQGMQGPMQGGMQGPMQGGMQGPMQGRMQGPMQGGMQGPMQGGRQGPMLGGMQGGMQSRMQGMFPRGMSSPGPRGASQSGTMDSYYGFGFQGSKNFGSRWNYQKGKASA